MPGHGGLAPTGRGRHLAGTVLTHRIIVADFYLLETDSHPLLPGDDYVWVNENDIGLYAVPRLVEKLLDLVKA